MLLSHFSRPMDTCYGIQSIKNDVLHAFSVLGPQSTFQSCEIFLPKANMQETQKLNSLLNTELL